MEQRPPMKPEPAPLSAHIPQNTPAPAPWRESTPGQARRSAAAAPAWTEPPPVPRSTLPRSPVAPLVSLLVIVGVAVLAIPMLFVLYEAANGWPSLAAGPVIVAPESSPAAPARSDSPRAEATAVAPAAVGSARSSRNAPTRRQRADALAAKGIELLQEGNAQAAALLFQDALSLDPASADGNYGLGYTLLHQGDSQGALPYICTAASTGNEAARRQALALLQANSLACP